MAGAVAGAGSQIISDAKAIGEAVLSPIDTLNSLKSLLTDPAARAAMGSAIVADLEQKIAVIQYSFAHGNGKGDAFDAGFAMGQLLATFATSVSGAGLGGKAVATLAKFGVRAGRQAAGVLLTQKMVNTLSRSWHQGTFPNMGQSIAYHLNKHGKGRTAVQYTKDAMQFYKHNKHLGKPVILKDGTRGIRIQTTRIVNGKKVKVGGFWTKSGKLVTFWD